MAQAKAAVAALTQEQRRDLTIVGITLDPENDTTERLADMAQGQEVTAPLFNFVTGEPAKVERVLDLLAVQRQRDPETGVIDHSNLFILVDRLGRVAYRLTLGKQQQRWLISALQVLLAEPAR
jgi:cytochrome oxidase Cu insertion factor (SCO1/SenC/PrrC family)